MTRLTLRRTLVVAVAGIVALSACGSDSDNADSTAPGTVAPGAAATDAPTAATDAPVVTDAVPATPYVEEDDGYYPRETDAPSADTDAPAAGDATTLTIKEFAFSDVTATAGTAFTLSNEDGFAHTVTNRDDIFDVRVEGGATESLTIDQPGTYEIFCRIHPSMSGTITVT